MASVIIVGAGMSGLAAAAQLVQKGLDKVTILEARDRIGGRFLVEEHNGHSLHMGAQWVHGLSGENAIFQLANKYGLLTTQTEIEGQGDMDHESFDLEHVYAQGGINIPLDLTTKAGEIYTQICQDLQNYCHHEAPDISKTVETFYKQKVSLALTNISDLEVKEALENLLLSLFLNILTGYTGDSIKKASAKYFGSAAEISGGDVTLPVQILDVFSKEIKGLESKLKLNSRVTQIAWSDQGVSVNCGSEEYKANFCILTLPPGVLAGSKGPVFHPALPKIKQEAYASLNPGAIGKYFIEWKHKWRPRNNHPIMFTWSKADMLDIKLPEDWIKGVYEICVEDPLSTLMLVWIVGDAARAADKLSDEVVKNDIGRLLNMFLKPETPIPAPDFLYRNRWTQDDLSFGCYTTASLQMNDSTFEAIGQPLPSTENPRLLFAGEATHPKFWSFLHGARESGIREAERILNKMSSSH